ncbi:Transmembrane transcriptional regulator (anti-sigma factor RsiW) [Rhizobium sp. NFR07]|uniref:anti-sigma factor family protein n=1 Tax=Rhizobium sp. NFR07 TaxID=1566262 RepID=UPI0008EC98E1|nr:anti-sigma factor [Rhizobium sp. NFR07]SFB45567.1 Transmembrane transcriptional regulator (anti-sigma factor RsiW) [Rhizobium sp. NFR07]
MTVANVEPSALEKRLSSFVDGQVSDTERQDIEALLVNDPEARILHDGLKRGGDVGRRLFDDMLKEPVPLDLVRGIKNAPLPRKAVRLPSAPRPMAFKPSGPQTLAACLATLILGGGIGYMIGTQPLGVTSPQLVQSSTAATRDWFDDIVAQYRLYTRQDNRMVEIGADRPADILQWLTTGTGVTFRIPDLNESGLTFLGARMIAADNTPTGILFYRRADADVGNDIIALTFSKVRPETSKPAEDIRIDTGLVSWSTPMATYVVVGPSSAADLDEIAAKAAGLI